MADRPLHFLSLTELSERLRRRELSPVEVTRAMVDRISALDGRIASYVTVLGERAMDQARQAEAEIARGQWRGPLHGVPIALKDLCFTSFAPTSGGTSVPIGAAQFCKTHRGDCAPNPGIDVEPLTDASWRQLIAINDQVNGSVAPVTDQVASCQREGVCPLVEDGGFTARQFLALFVAADVVIATGSEDQDQCCALHIIRG